MPTNEDDRTSYIGSSEAKDILDGRWFDLWRIKTGRQPAPDLTDEFRVQLGIFTENFHLDWTIARMINAGEIAGEACNRQDFYVADDASYIGSHVDATVLLPPSFVPNGAVPIPAQYAPVEAKHSSGKRTMDELLEWYMPQMQHHLWCTGASKGVLSVIQGNAEPERMWIGRSQEWIDVYARSCAQFWHYVENDIQPPGFSPAAVIEPKVKDAIPINGLVRRCVDGDNAFISVARDMIDNEGAARVYENAKKSLKDMMGPDDGELYSKILTLKRDARGAIRMTVHKDKEIAA